MHELCGGEVGGFTGGSQLLLEQVAVDEAGCIHGLELHVVLLG